MADGSIIIDTKIDTDGLKKGFEQLKTESGSVANVANKSVQKINESFSGVDVSKAAAALRTQIAQMEGQMQNIQNQYKQALANDDDKGASQLGAKYEAIYDKIAVARAKLAVEVGNAARKQTTQEESAATGSSAAAERTSKGQERVAKSTERTTKVVSKLQSILKSAANAVGSFGGKLKSAVSGFGKMIFGAKNFSKSMSGVTASFKRLFPAILATEGVIGILRKAVSTYMQQNQQLESTLQGAWLNLGNILGPVIDRMVSLISTALAYLTKFLNLLGFVGKSTSTQINNAGGAAKKESDKLKKQLASFDELNILQSQKESESGGGGGVSSPETVTPEVALPDWATMMAEQLRGEKWAEAAETLTSSLDDMVDKVDWAGIGKTIGEKFNGALTFIATFIKTFDWFSLGTNLASGVNNIISNVDWSNLGVILGAKFKIIVEGLGGFFSEFDWAAAGQALSDTIMGLFSSIDFTQAGETLSAGLLGVLDAITVFIQETDWQEIGGQIADFIASIDWSGLTSALAKGVGAAIAGIASLIWGFIEDAWDDVVSWWNETAFEDGKFTIEGLLNGIWEAIKNIGTWIYDNIFKPFIDGFKSVFGINSPSKVMEEQAGFIIDGLLQGLTGTWNKIKEWLDGIFEKDWSESFGAIGEVMNGFFAGVKSIWDGIKRIFEGIITFIDGVFSGNWEKAWEGIKEIFGGIWDALVGLIKAPINAIIGLINGLVSGITNGINGAINALNSIKVNVPSWIPVIGGKSFGFNIPTLTAPQIPYLAKGAVIPPNEPFMAVLGDQRRGTNIEAPLETIQEAVAIVMQDMAAANLAGFEETIGVLREILEAIYGIQIGDDVIGRAVARYNRKLAVQRG